MLSTNLVQLLQEKRFARPDSQAFTYLLDGGTEAVSMTNADLDRRARSIGNILSVYTKPGDRILLLYPPGLEFIESFFGCLYAGCIAVPAFPPPLKRPVPRLQSIVRDSQATVALTLNSVLSDLRRRLDNIPELKLLHWVTTDTADLDLINDWVPPHLDGNTIAFLQYTSGSTGTPKGVVITHENLISNLAFMHSALHLSPEDKCVSWLPAYHDMGLIGGILQPLFSGFPSILMAPVAFLQHPMRWLWAISQHGATYSGAPNFAYDLCVERITPEERSTLNLGNWKFACVAAEPVRAKTLQSFADTFKSCGFKPSTFCPGFGLAEATLAVAVSAGRQSQVFDVINADKAALRQRRIVESPLNAECQVVTSCGDVIGTQTVAIVDPDTSTRCESDEIGEIWISGPCVAKGYWNQVNETKETFGARLDDSADGPFLRSGDLGFLRNGKLYVTGRLKDVILIRGANYFPQDIEQTVETCHTVLVKNSGAAFSVDINDVPKLVVVQELKRHHQLADLSQVLTTIRHAIVDQHGLSVHAVLLVKVGGVPKTSSGKVQRYLCREKFVDGGYPVIAEWREESEIANSKNSNESGRAPQMHRPKLQFTVAGVQDWMISQIAQRLKINPANIDIRETFSHLGLDSLNAVNITGELETWLEMQLSPTLAYEFPTIELLSQHIVTITSPSRPHLTVASNKSPHLEPIAIIGLGCRFPGAKNPNEFWSLLLDGKDAIEPIPDKRWSDRVTPHNSVKEFMPQWGGYLEQIDQFDNHFFGISPREAIQMDPQQRLLLEVAWEALEDAGQTVENIKGSQTAVIIGISTNDYSTLQPNDYRSIDAYTGTGNAFSIAANRLSYTFDLRGPSFAIDTACSSSLIAVYEACNCLWHGEATLALAGGVNLILSPAIAINFARAGLMAPDGRCKAFDADANGYVRSEGAGIAVLKPLSQALADKDSIYALIRGGAINHDGRTNGLVAPSRQAQEHLLREAYGRAAVSPSQVRYVEAHGTGTLLGDAIEVSALGMILSIDRPFGDVCTIGSVKTNIGHLEAAAGIAGLIKTALVLKNRRIPPSLHFRVPNPHIDFTGIPIEVQQSTTILSESQSPIIAGISSFGFGGANAHLVLEEFLHKAGDDLGRNDSADNSTNLLLLSARSSDALQSLSRSYRDMLNTAFAPSVSDICYTSAIRRSHHDYRLAITLRSKAEAVELLNVFLQGEEHAEMSKGRRSINKSANLAFVFSGQGSQWLGMGQRLISQEPVFRTTLDQCDQLIRKYRNWSLMDKLGGTSRLDDIETIQPTIFSIQVGLAALWRSWDVYPDAIVGHSMGEVAGAFVSGMVSLEEAVHVICHRSHLLTRLVGQGRMAAVSLPVEDTRNALARYGDALSIAAINSPTSTVVSGDILALRELLETLQNSGVFCRLINVDVASHSSQIDILSQEILEELDGISPTSGTIPMYSTVTGSLITGTDLDNGYWLRNLREPVRFLQATQQLISSGHNIFVEVSPHPVLLSALRETLASSQTEGNLLPSLTRERHDRGALLSTLGKLYTLGHSANWNKLYPNGGELVPFPSYPWQREHFYLRPPLSDDASGPTSLPIQGNRLGRIMNSGVHFEAADRSQGQFWEFELDDLFSQFMYEHRISGMSLLPATGFIEVVVLAATYFNGTILRAVAHLEFMKALFLEPNQSRIVQIRLMPGAMGETQFAIHSRPKTQGVVKKQWLLHATGDFRNDGLGNGNSDGEGPRLFDIRQRFTTEVPPENLVELLEATVQPDSNAYNVERLWRTETALLAVVSAAELMRFDPDEYCIHPAILPTCLQLYSLAVPSPETKRQVFTYIPTYLRQARLRGNATGRLWIYVSYVGALQGENDIVEGNVLIFDEAGKPLIDLSGIRLQQVADDQYFAEVAGPDELFYQLEWRPQIRPVAEGSTPNFGPIGQGKWLIFGDYGWSGHALTEHLEKLSEEFVHISPGADYRTIDDSHIVIRPQNRDDMRRVLDQAFRSPHNACRGIIQLFAASPIPSDADAIGSSDSSFMIDLLSSINLVREVATFSWDAPPRLWLVTEGAQLEAESSAVFQSTLWGLGRTIAQEHGTFWGGLIDLDPNADALEKATVLWQEITNPNGEDQVAFRHHERYVLRLIRTRIANSTPTGPKVRSDGSYLVTGGLGDLGLEVAHWLVKQGARQLILLGRTVLPSRDQWNNSDALDERTIVQIRSIRALEALGASVITASVDVADYGQLQVFLEQMKQSGLPAIRGVVHAAGIVQLSSITELDSESLLSVLRPKVAGGWFLHTLFKDCALDFFVLFSSAASILSSPLLASYAAANAFLDTLAVYRRSLGLPALSINWGPWSEIGIVARYRKLSGRAYLIRGMNSISPRQGIELFERLFNTNEAQLAVLPVDWEEWSDLHPSTSKTNILSDLLGSSVDVKPDLTALGHESRLLRSSLRAANADQKQSLVDAYLCRLLAHALKIPLSELGPDESLTNLGLDSLMAIEVKNAVQRDLRVIVPILSFFREITIPQLAHDIIERLPNDVAELSKPTVGRSDDMHMDVAGSTQRPFPDLIPRNSEQLLEKLDELSDEDVDRLLRNMLDNEAT